MRKSPAPAATAFESLRTRFCSASSHELRYAVHRPCFLDDPAVLQPPLQRIGDGQVADFRRFDQYLVSQCLGFNVTDWQHSFLEERENVVAVGIVLHQAAEPGGSLMIRGPFLLH